ncbi:MAG: short-chain dehydrogenase/reductase [Blastococcus sp.]|jgi:2-hydroxycyclohexanecarboxyl-CoA dehydrogenase|nr:short-chain dehydrogenase/reductase [Blastococcus sp.]
MTSTLAVVTGAGSGIGRAIAHGLAEEGRLVACLDINRDGAAETVAAIEAQGGQARAFYVDIADTESVAAVSREVQDQCGSPWVLVNNAGWNQIQPFLQTSSDFWKKILDINLLGTVAMSFHFANQMVEQGNGGRIVNISSDSGRVGSSGESVYSGAKGGVIGFTKGLARELIRHKITSNCVSPGPTNTPLMQTAPPKLAEALNRAIPARRLAEPADIMQAVRFFASESNGYITGQTLSVSGGLTMA